MADRREWDLEIPTDTEAGHYADFVSIWHTKDSFVLDFSVLKRPPRQVEGSDGSPVTKVPAKVVSRIRVPPKQVFEIMKGLEQQLSTWERQTGQVPPRREPGEDPGEAGPESGPDSGPEPGSDVDSGGSS